ncbi:hypothetical protein McanMca71_005095 [Microsporum canis]|uniref:SigF-like NTF2-like domain-containing protein n=1 Tax=Arthroderma otae (strain ATCC MYA-4605 / CBS 113480) TaxID=554155 RepID=C5FWM7_ARTOC|nr:conserved hypothetical protein [Microsporum canis CBS 113480]EEQ34311.1 conserved hypothetical protein [Microsporum canis CBS 113480]
MENPVAEIPRIIHLLTQSVPSVQRQTIEKYFTTSASITHPFLHSGSFQGSRWLIVRIFLFYKIMSPHVDLQVKSVAFDYENLLLYVTISQIFRIFIIPFYTAPVTLTTVLQLVEIEEQNSPVQQRRKVPVVELTNSNTDLLASPPESVSSSSTQDDELTVAAVQPAKSSKPLYYIASQNDLYQTNEYIKFIVPYGIGSTLVLFWHFFATVFCVIASFIFWPIAWVEEKGTLH